MVFTPTQSLSVSSRRLALTTKQAAKGTGYYKGNRTGSHGWHTIWGGYIIDLRKVRTYKVPLGWNTVDTPEFTPFVGEHIKAPRKIPKRTENTEKIVNERKFESLESWNGRGKLNGQRYLQLFREWFLKDNKSDPYEGRDVSGGEERRYETDR